MARSNPIKELMSAIIALFILVAFIPIFKEMGVNFSFMPLFIFAIILIFIVGIIVWLKEQFF